MGIVPAPESMAPVKEMDTIAKQRQRAEVRVVKGGPTVGVAAVPSPHYDASTVPTGKLFTRFAIWVKQLIGLSASAVCSIALVFSFK